MQLNHTPFGKKPSPPVQTQPKKQATGVISPSTPDYQTANGYVLNALCAISHSSLGLMFIHFKHKLVTAPSATLGRQRS
jgi:hypothetical protein